jgi:hypothetical protein
MSEKRCEEDVMCATESPCIYSLWADNFDLGVGYWGRDVHGDGATRVVTASRDPG